MLSIAFLYDYSNLSKDCVVNNLTFKFSVLQNQFNILCKASKISSNPDPKSH